MGFLTNLDNGISAFKSAFASGVTYARLSEGTHSYNYETERMGMFSALGFGQTYFSPKENAKNYYKDTLFLASCINLYADFASQAYAEIVTVVLYAIEGLAEIFLDFTGQSKDLNFEISDLSKLFKGAFYISLSMVKSVLEVIKTVVYGVVDAFKDLGGILRGLFSGDWDNTFVFGLGSGVFRF